MSQVNPVRLRPGGSAFVGAAFLLLFVLAAYGPVWRAGFVWDDDSFTTANLLVRRADGLGRIWLPGQTVDYWPVTYSAFWLEWRLWGANPLGYHLASVFLHGSSAVLLWAVLRQLVIPGAWAGAVFFAVHPVNAEAVAWIAQQKTLLAAVFFLTAALLWLRPGRGAYAGSLAAFVFAMLSKGSAAFLPFVLIGIALWRGRLGTRGIRSLLPFILVAVGLGALDIVSQTGWRGEGIRHLTALQRLWGGASAFWFYLGKALWPHSLAFVYRGPTPRRLSVLAWAAVTAALWIFRARGSRPVLAFWIYYGAALAPALGFVDVAFMKYSPVADHYQYLALLGFCAALGTLLAGRLVLVGALAALLAVLTWRQASLYANGERLFRHAVEENRGAWMAWDQLGEIASNQGREEEAVVSFQRALSVRSDLPETHNALGNAFLALGRLGDAEREYRQSIALKPGLAQAHANLGVALMDRGRFEESGREFAAALVLLPHYPETENNWGVLLVRSGRPSEAVRHFERALAERPDYLEAAANLADARSKLP